MQIINTLRSIIAGLLLSVSTAIALIPKNTPTASPSATLTPTETIRIEPSPIPSQIQQVTNTTSERHTKAAAFAYMIYSMSDEGKKRMLEKYGNGGDDRKTIINNIVADLKANPDKLAALEIQMTRYMNTNNNTPANSAVDSYNDTMRQYCQQQQQQYQDCMNQNSQEMQDYISCRDSTRRSYCTKPYTRYCVKPACSN